jgi:hypothetical protein
LLLSEEFFNETAWRIAAEESQVVMLEKLWDFAKELQLKPEELSNDFSMS